MRELQFKSDQKKRHSWRERQAGTASCRDCGLVRVLHREGDRHWTTWQRAGHLVGNSLEGDRTPACIHQPEGRR